MGRQDHAPVRWGVLGTGQIAEQFTVAARGLEGADVVAVASRRLATAEQFGHRHGIPRHYDDYGALAGDPAVDAVYVAGPHSEHHRQTLLCLAAGKPVLCEKPFALNAREAAEMIAAARANGVFLMEAMWTRFFPAMVEVRRLVADGAIGEVTIVLADLGWRLDRPPEHRLYNPWLGGGALLDLGVYPVSLASMLFSARAGEPSGVAAAGVIGPTGVDLHTSMVLDYGGVGSASLACSIQLQMPRRAVLVGPEGRIKLAEFLAPDGFTLRRDGAEPAVFSYPYRGSGMEFEIEEVARCLREGRIESAAMPLEESLAVMRTLDRLRAEVAVRYPGDTP